MKPSGIEWIGYIPDDWEVRRGKYTLDLLMRPIRDNDEIITCFRDGQVTRRSNRREDGFTFADKEIGYQGILKGDLVIHGMDGFAGAIGISDSDGKGSPVLNVCRPKNGSDTRYINYYLRTLALQNVFIALSTGIRERSCDLRWKKIAELLFTIPPLKTQQKIADYLDEKCGEIDATISKQKESIEKLKAYKQSLISETVTKGLDKSAPLKPSGIKWLGEIPQNARIIRLRFLSSIQTGDKDTVNRVENGKYPFYVRSPIVERIDTFSFDGEAILMAGDGVGAGKVFHYVNGKFDYHQRVYNIHNLKGVLGKFLYYYLRENFYKEIEQSNAKSTVDSIRLPMLLDFPIIVYPYDLQKEMVSFLDKKVAEIDAIIIKKQNIIQKLDAYKKSLIFECVTGKQIT